MQLSKAPFLRNAPFLILVFDKHNCKNVVSDGKSKDTDFSTVMEDANKRNQRQDLRLPEFVSVCDVIALLPLR